MNLVRGIESKDAEVNRMGTYFGLASAFGFTPDEVDEIDMVTIESLAIIGKAKNEEDERAMRSGRR